MIKVLKVLAISAISIFLLITLAATIKFNFIDVPYVGGAMVYIDQDGKELKLYHKADGSVVVRFEHNGEPITFVGTAEMVASGSQYMADNGDFAFWSKGTKARVFNAMWQPIFTGLISTEQQVESIRFSPSEQRWFDDVGTCHTCTVENGFGQDGSVDNVIWQELNVGLKNDLAESPSIQEVQILFEQHYAQQPGQYPVHVSYEQGKFTILVAVAKELKGIDLLDPRGPLFATYEVLLE